MHYYLVGQCREGVNSLKGQKAAGFPTEFKSFGDNITYKPGYHCCVAAAPSSGKSYWVLHTTLHLAEKYDHKTFVYSPELGSREEIVALLIHMKSGKTIYDIEGIEKISDEEEEKCLKWLNNHFIIYDPVNIPSIEDLYEEFKLCQKEYDIKINNIIIDNLNDCQEPIGLNGRQDLGVEAMFGMVRRFNKELQCYTFLVTHSASQGAPTTQNGITYYRPITPREIRSGEAIYRKAYLLLTIWRTPFGLSDESGIPYEENESHIIVLKGKPANTAKKGFVGKIFYDWKTSKFTDQRPPIKTYF